MLKKKLQTEWCKKYYIVLIQHYVWCLDYYLFVLCVVHFNALYYKSNYVGVVISLPSLSPSLAEREKRGALGGEPLTQRPMGNGDMVRVLTLHCM